MRFKKNFITAYFSLFKKTIIESEIFAASILNKNWENH